MVCSKFSYYYSQIISLGKSMSALIWNTLFILYLENHLFKAVQINSKIIIRKKEMENYTNKILHSIQEVQKVVLGTGHILRRTLSIKWIITWYLIVVLSWRNKLNIMSEQNRILRMIKY